MAGHPELPSFRNSSTGGRNNGAQDSTAAHPLQFWKAWQPPECVGCTSLVTQLL